MAVVVVVEQVSMPKASQVSMCPRIQCFACFRQSRIWQLAEIIVLDVEIHFFSLN